MIKGRTLLTCGEHAVLVEVGGLDEVLALAQAIREAIAGKLAGFTDVVDIVPAARTVLVVVRDDAPMGPVRQALLTLPDAQPGERPSSGETLEVPVHYDGPDLAEVAKLTGLSVNGVIAAHTGTEWTVAFGGFAPGFAYLTGGDPRLKVPRRREPRTAVPSGSVGLAGEFSAVYPRSSPGGWQLIGRTDIAVFNPDREPPALLQSGAVVHFVDVSGGRHGG
jgi:KipI family sensor histidine kinase inhibitor